MMNNTGILVQIIGAVVDADFSQAETLPALLNALEVAGKKIGDVRVVVNGAGARPWFWKSSSTSETAGFAPWP